MLLWEWLPAVSQQEQDLFFQLLLNEEGLAANVTVTQTGCIGICQYEPVVEIYEAGKEKVTYVKMNPKKAAEVVEKHLKGGKVIEEYIIK